MQSGRKQNSIYPLSIIVGGFIQWTKTQEGSSEPNANEFCTDSPLSAHSFGDDDRCAGCCRYEMLLYRTYSSVLQSSSWRKYTLKFKNWLNCPTGRLNLAQKLKRAYLVIYWFFSKRPKAVDRQTENPPTSDSQLDRGEQLSGARRLASARRTIDTTTSSKHARQKRIVSS